MVYTYFVYILQCFRNGTYKFYRGRTNNFKRRYYEHKNKRCKYTKRYNGNLHPVYLEVMEFRRKKDGEKWSIKREKQLKNWSREKVKKEIRLNENRLNELIQKYTT